MSAKYTFWAWEVPITKAPLKLTLLQLADNANDDGVSWYSVPKMAIRCGMSERAIQGHIKTLVDMGILRITERPGTSRIYHLQYQEAVFLKNPNQGGGEQQHPRRICAPPPQNLRPTPAESADDPNNEPNNIKTSSSENANALSDTDTGSVLSNPESAIQSGSKWGTADDLKAAEWMFSQVRNIAPKAKKPNLALWSNEVRLMRERDGRTHREICTVFKWASEDTNFWQGNVLSPAALRKNFDMLEVQSRRKAGGANRDAIDFDNTDWAEGLVI